MTDDLLIKNNCILELEREKARKPRNDTRISDLARRAAELEGTIARDLLSKGRKQEAVINLISQASCLVDAREVKEARKVFKHALGLASDAKIKNFVKDEIEALPDDLLEPGEDVTTLLVIKRQTRRRS